MTVSSSPTARRMQGVPGNRASLGHAPATPYFALKYYPSAPPGLPPAIQASWVTVDDSADGPWVRFFLTPPLGSESRESLCILRVHQSDLAEYVEHGSLFGALIET